MNLSKQIIFALFLIFLTPTQLVWAQTYLSGKVIGISDGDTITILDHANRRHKIRLAFIDAPEKNQHFGAQSKNNLSKLIYKQDVSIQVIEQDRYGRTVGIVIAQDTDVNHLMLQSGSAWHYKFYAKNQSKQDFTAYAQAEEYARTQQLGLWHASNPTAPWEYRRQRR